MSRIVLGITGTKTYENRIKIKNFIHKLREQTDLEIEIVGLGDGHGADKYVKKFALELGYNYREMNPPHTTKNLYSLMTESYYEKPYSHKNMFIRNQIFCQYVNKCVIFDDSNTTDKKVNALIKQLTKVRKKAIILTP
jgi:hypothetical protein